LQGTTPTGGAGGRRQKKTALAGSFGRGQIRAGGARVGGVWPRRRVVGCFHAALGCAGSMVIGPLITRRPHLVFSGMETGGSVLQFGGGGTCGLPPSVVRISLGAGGAPRPGLGGPKNTGFLGGMGASASIRNPLCHSYTPAPRRNSKGRDAPHKGTPRRSRPRSTKPSGRAVNCSPAARDRVCIDLLGDLLVAAHPATSTGLGIARAAHSPCLFNGGPQHRFLTLAGPRGCSDFLGMCGLACPGPGNVNGGYGRTERGVTAETRKPGRLGGTHGLGHGS